MASTGVNSFSIGVPDSAIDALHQKLSLATFPDELEDAEWALGSPLADVKRLTAYWKDQFDWKAAEKKLNDELPQFTTKIQADGFEELTIHFLWKKSGNPKAVPLLFVHGWPGNFLEASKIITPLSSNGSPEEPVFDVVVPSLPNYGFSEGSKKKGFGFPQYAETFHKLMQKLGYPTYGTCSSMLGDTADKDLLVTQGGDLGFYITRTMGLLYPESCKASHLNFPLGSQPSFREHPFLALQHAITPYTPGEKEGLARRNWFLTEGAGYRYEQTTKPQTLGYAFADSPVALLAWIYEKLHDWTDSYPWTEDEICTWISIYWFSTAGPAANVRIYYESIHPFLRPDITRERLSKWIPTVPLGLAYFPKELQPVPKTWARTLGPVVYESENEHGGHFAGWERPEIIVKDLKAMFGKGGKTYGVVSGRDGYGTS